MTDLLARGAGDSALQAQRLQLQVDALNDLAAAIRVGEPLERALPRVAARAASLVGGDKALIALLDAEGQLEPALPDGQPGRPVVCGPESHASRIVERGLPVIVNDLADARLSAVDRDIAGRHGITGFVATP